MKTLLTFPSGATSSLTIADVEALLPGRVQSIPAIDGTPLVVGSSFALGGGVTLAVVADEVPASPPAGEP